MNTLDVEAANALIKDILEASITNGDESLTLHIDDVKMLVAYIELLEETA